MSLAPEKFRDEELIQPREIFVRNGAEVTLASTKIGVATGMLGAREEINATLDDVAGETYDAIVVVGGRGAPEYLWDNARLHDLLRRHHQMGKIVAAICLSGAVLAKAGLLKGLDATVWKSEETTKLFSECGVNFQDKPVVQSGNIITGQGPFAARQFAETILNALRN